ncbi:MAG: MFS transporter [Verrucomicrobia bacterium]|nr:MFS transporter [Verrucomicrobiota bacterium]
MSNHKFLRYGIAAAVMFLTLFAWGVYFVPMGRYLSVAFPGDSNITGFAYGAGPLAAMISALIAGWLADKAISARRLFFVLAVVGGVLLWLVPSGKTSSAFSGLLFCHALCYFAALPLLNAIVLRTLGSDSQYFPWFRSSGTIGWIASGYAIGIAANAMGVADVATNAVIFKMGAVAFVAAGVLALFLAAEDSEQDSAKSDDPTPSVFVLLADAKFMVFLVFSFLFCIPLSLYFTYANAFIASRGVANPEAIMTIGQYSEIVFLLLLPFAFNYLTAKRALLVGMACWALRYAIFAKSGNTEWMLITGIALHGLCYDFFFVTGMQYADRRAPAGLRNLAQSAVSWVTLGLGLWAGNMIAPLLDSRFIDRTKPGVLVFKDEFWLYPSIFAAVLLVIFAMFYKDDTRLSDKANG